MKWRWDQGRLDYLRFDNLKKCARVLVTLEGAQVNDGDPLRKPLMDKVGLPFAPGDYRVWRNYGRVFKCAMLATTIKNEVVCTDLCRDIADWSKATTVDEYLSYVAPRFYYDSPAFQGYLSTGPQHFPFCSILKLLLARAASGQPATVSIDEIFDLLVGNEVTGLESVEDFGKLPSSGYAAKGDEPRQLRLSLRVARGLARRSPTVSAALRAQCDPATLPQEVKEARPARGWPSLKEPSCGATPASHSGSQKASKSATLACPCGL